MDDSSTTSTLVLMISEKLHDLCYCVMWLLDRMYVSKGRPFTQLYTVHGAISLGERMKSLTYVIAFMKSKTMLDISIGKVSLFGIDCNAYIYSV